MRRFGFSTGALAKGDFRRGIELQRREDIRAIELSALREHELQPLLEAFGDLDLSSFDYVSFHAPSSFEQLDEAGLVDLILKNLPENVPVIVHPDAIGRPDAWRQLGGRLCLENMDRRKPVGRTTRELAAFFREFANAGFCLDLAHARHVDTTMSLATELIARFGDRLVQIHLSEVTPTGRHVAISRSARNAFRTVTPLVPDHVPVIIESVITEHAITDELQTATHCFTPAPAVAAGR